jgi:TPR repeat protein
MKILSLLLIFSISLFAYLTGDYFQALDYYGGDNISGKNPTKQINYKKAKLYFEKSIEFYEKRTKKDYYKRLPHSYFYLGVIYQYGEGGVKQDYKKAFQLFKKAADLGYASAQFGLAELYRYGDGVKKDVQTAVFWYKEAIKQGNLASMLNLGNIYSRGEGNVKMNKIIAYKLWSKCSRSTSTNTQAIEMCQNQLSYMCKENPWACK